MTIAVFGHTSPDTDSTGSPIIWAWYLNEIKGVKAKPVLLGQPNTEAAFVLKHWGFALPEIIEDVEDDQPVVIVDTNNPAELPKNINRANILGIIDHHRLVGGLKSRSPLEIRIEPLACTASLMHKMIGADMAKMPEGVKGLMLSCILSDTLEFRSPTTTDLDKSIALDLAKELGISASDYAAQMFAAKSDVSAFSDAQLLRMDSKEFELPGTKFRISVLETTAPAGLLGRKDSLMASMAAVAREDGVDQVLLFVIDILKEQATLLIPNDMVRSLVANSFGVIPSGDTVVLPGVMSRKKQIIPKLKL